MKPAVAELKWSHCRQRIIDWRNKRHEDQLATLECAEARSIGILQKRYGYTREQATTTELRKHCSKAWLG